MERLCSIRDVRMHIMSFLWLEEKHQLCLGLRIKITSTHAEFNHIEFIPLLRDYDGSYLKTLSLRNVDLSYLRGLSIYNLHSLTLEPREGTTVYDVDILHQLPLEEFSLSYTPGYSDDMFVLGDITLFQRLKHLTLRNVKLTLGTQPLSKLHLTRCHVGGSPPRTLTDLTISQCRSLNLQPLDREWFKTIAKCRLHQLSLFKIDITRKARFPRTVSHLTIKECTYRNYNFLSRLSLTSLAFTGSHLNVIWSWICVSRLEHLSLNWVDFNDADCVSCPSLKSLDAEGLIPSHVLHLFNANLTRVYVGYTGYGGVEIDLTPLREDLTELSLARVQVNSDNLNVISRLANLTKLSLTGVPLNNLEFMITLKLLKDVSLIGCDVTDLSHMAGLPLNTLNLTDNPIEDATLVYLSNMPVHDLNLDQTNVTDDGLMHLARLPLRRLVLSAIKGNGLVHLQQLPLRQLKFWTYEFDPAYKPLLHTFPIEVTAPLPYNLSR